MDQQVRSENEQMDLLALGFIDDCHLSQNQLKACRGDGATGKRFCG